MTNRVRTIDDFNKLSERGRFIVETGKTSVESQGTPTVKVADTKTGTEYFFYNTKDGHFAAVKQGDNVRPMDSEEAWAELKNSAKADGIRPISLEEYLLKQDSREWNFVGSEAEEDA